MGNVNIGQLDRRISIKRAVVSKDDYGAAVVTWTTFATVWANMQDALLSRAESVTQGALKQAVNQTRFRFRYLADLDSSMRIEHNDVVYNIVGGPAEIGDRRMYQEVMAERYAA